MNIIQKTVRKISMIMSEIACWLVLALVLVICLDVVARYVFNHAIYWVYEMSYILGAFIAAMGIAQLMIDAGNVRVDMFYVKFSKKAQLIIDIVFGGCFFLPAYVALTNSVIKNCWTAYMTGETSVITTWYPKVWPIKLVLCIGLVMFLIVYFMILIEKVGEIIRMFRKGETQC